MDTPDLLHVHSWASLQLHSRKRQNCERDEKRCLKLDDSGRERVRVSGTTEVSLMKVCTNRKCDPITELSISE